MRRFKIAGTFMGLLIGTMSACGSPSEPQIVEITGRLISPNGNEGAAVIEITRLTAPVNFGDYNSDEFHLGSSGEVHRLVIVNTEPGVISFTLFVNEADEPPVATVIEVAGPDDQLRQSLDGYRVEFAPAVLRS